MPPEGLLKEKGGCDSHNLRESGRKEKEKKRNSKGRNPGKRKRFREKLRESAEEGAPVVAKRAPDEKEKTSGQ